MTTELEQVKFIEFLKLVELLDVSYTIDPLPVDRFLKWDGVSQWQDYDLFGGTNEWTGTNTHDHDSLRILNPLGTFSYRIRGSAISANVNATIPAILSSQNFVMDAHNNTFTGANIQRDGTFTFHSKNLQISDDGTHTVGIDLDAAQTATDLTVAFPLLATNDTFALIGVDQTFAGSNVFSGTNTFSATNSFNAQQDFNNATSTVYNMHLDGTSTASALKWIKFEDGGVLQGEVHLTLGFFGFQGVLSAFFGVNLSNYVLLSTLGTTTYNASVLHSFIGAKVQMSGELELDGDFNHDGTNLGVYGVAPVARPAAYTQTYSTATRTHSNLTSATLTDSSGGTANTTVVAVPVVGGSGASTAQENAINDNFADVTAQINALRVDLENAKQVLNQVIDDDQSQGLKQ